MIDSDLALIEGCATRTLGRLQATDADAGENARIIYHLDGNEYVYSIHKKEIP